VYEPGGTLDSIRKRVTFFMDKMNEEFPAKKLELVLFADALKHLLRLNRLLEMPRGSALLVGVGGSGKQSLTRLASYISRANCFQVSLQYTVECIICCVRLSCSRVCAVLCNDDNDQAGTL
jgi:dynein heavy chain, axonemal